MAKRLSDYPWFRFHVAKFVYATMGMNDEEVGMYMRRIVTDWVHDDFDGLPEWVKDAAAERFEKTTTYSRNRSTVVDNCETIVPVLSDNTSISLSSLSEDLQKKKEEGSGEKEETTPLPKKSEVPKPAWVTDYQTYLKESEPEFDRLIADWWWIAEKKEYHRNALIRKTIERMWHEFWGTPAGWENKKAKCWDRQKRRWREIDWEATITNNLRRNLVYLAKGERDEEADWVERCRLNASKTIQAVA